MGQGEVGTLPRARRSVRSWVVAVVAGAKTPSIFMRAPRRHMANCCTRKLGNLAEGRADAAFRRLHTLREGRSGARRVARRRACARATGIFFAGQRSESGLSSASLSAGSSRNDQPATRSCAADEPHTLDVKKACRGEVEPSVMSRIKRPGEIRDRRRPQAPPLLRVRGEAQL